MEGIAAHSWPGFVNGHADSTSPLSAVVDHVIPDRAKRRMRQAMILFVDEIGTVSAELA